MIELEGVTKRFPGGALAVDDLSLSAPERAITVLVGPSGCGKTTTLRMINRMVDPTSGTIRIDGTDIHEMDPAQLRRGIGYVIQHGGLFPHHTVERNVAAVPLLLGEKSRTAFDRARELLERVGMDPALGRRYPSQLSGGQQQRVGVARALAADPPVMLMDEPFSAVDPVVREQLQDEFLRLQGELGKTIVMVTHDIDEAIKLGDHVAVLRTGGVLAQMATPRDLLASPADGFVADFLGKDRGYRALGFDAEEYPVHEELTVVIGTPVGTAGGSADSDGWVLVTDEERHPLGWARPADAEDAVTREDLALGGTLATVDGPLRGALDAALSSPSRRGVVVDDDGLLVGTCLATEVLEVIESRDRQQAPSGARP
ncbi:ABC transporter ATP-binding protein [Janibacter cremeus]|uniref:ABC-type quaternary amine transporter n=1 Tax=Janibacter cremeus TaxID=1285192 RepID=A0A852VNS8_9MICO|nr:ATP-binding cassette domain-containing protein [Janibacter cremeus]NYF98652.1 osmoprotectant transport system ATP-binding protein [Janibacter cremeus]